MVVESYKIQAREIIHKHGIKSVIRLKKVALTIFHFAGPNTFICIASYRSFKVNSYIATAKHDIVQVGWLVKAFATEEPLTKLPAFHPHDMIFVTKKLQQKFNDEFDEYGDSYTIPVTENELQELMDKMNSDVSKTDSAVSKN